MSVVRTVAYFTFAAILIGGFFTDVEARRKVLQGRRTITREYYSQSVLPPWAKLLLIGIAILFGAAIVYGILWKFLINDLQ
ncbi:hypothetical protein GE061_017607 [Apolygus lucorum]|uniref:Uncharacterized protein n=1 Tax=Apolygus lucorum TaxID=248454 RepID=A0A6A4J8Z6_APOLU|nr:hypothetical protein GE061_017607 [Apolygus lucorum]